MCAARPPRIDSIAPRAVALVFWAVESRQSCHARHLICVILPAKATEH